ncbi:MAG: biotin/lipoate A/B protein ligase family protein [Planctomycetota bacterium]
MASDSGLSCHELPSNIFFQKHMKLLDVKLSCNLQNIALDEAVLERAERGECTDELMRFWEPMKPIVVIGRSSPIEMEVDLDFCRQNDIAVVRRASGGQSVVNGPGCLIYSVLISYEKRPELRMLDNAHEFVMGRMRSAIDSLGVEVQMEGTCDLTLAHLDGSRRKVSGNALRCRQNWMLYHGTMLCDADLELISNCLGRPKRMPDYRKERTHSDFLAQLPVNIGDLQNAITSTWQIKQSTTDWPEKLTDELVRHKYQNDEWNYKVR